MPRYEPSRDMPFLSSLTPKGTTYTRALASSPWTVPSHVSLLTGLPAWSVHYHPGKLHIPTAPSLASHWQEEGGEAVAFSGNGLVAPDYGTLTGYDKFNWGAPNRTVAPRIWRWVSPFLGNAPHAERRAITPFFSTERGPGQLRRPAFLLGHRAIGTAVHAGARLLSAGVGLNWGIDRVLRQREANRPFHLFVNYMEAHEPYTLHPGFCLARLPTNIFLPTMGLALRHSSYRDFPPASRMVIESYRRAMRALDRRLVSLFAILLRRGILEDALVVLASDHGQSLGERGFFGHGYVLDEPVIRVPVVAWSFHHGRAVPIKGGETSDWFDHRHLFHAFRLWMNGQQGVALTEHLDESIRSLGPALAYWEGPDVHDAEMPEKWESAPSPNRALRAYSGRERLEITQGIEEGVDGMRLSGPSNDSALADKVRQIVGKGWTVPDSKPSTDLQYRLRSWGYL